MTHANENTNGIIRQLISKGKNFAESIDTDIIVIQEKLYDHLRKIIEFHNIKCDVSKI